MNIRIRSFLVYVVLILVMLGSSCFAKDIDVVMNGEKIKFDAVPILENGRTLVPFRKIFEELNYKVEWNENERKVTATKKGKEIELVIDNKNIVVNNETISSDVAPKIIHSRTYVPIRIVSEYSDCDVLWDDVTKTVLIYTKQEEYKECMKGSNKRITTDGKYIYYSPYAENAYRFTTDLKREILPFEIGDSLAICNNKLYARFENEKNHYYIGAIDLKKFKSADISKEDVGSFVLHNNKIYYEYFPTSLDKNSGIYVMDINGKNKKRICYSQSGFENFYVTDDYIFTDGKMYSIENGKEKNLINSNCFVTATAIDDTNYYMAIEEYKSEVHSLVPIGVCAYNYRNGKTVMHSFERLIKDIEVTDNSIYLTCKNDSEYVKEYLRTTESYFILRLTKKFEYPVEICKGTNYRYFDENGDEIKFFGGVSADIDVIGNYVYYNHISSSGIDRVSTDGKEETSLNEFWKYEVTEESDKKYKYTIADFTNDLRNKNCW